MRLLLLASALLLLTLSGSTSALKTSSSTKIEKVGSVKVSKPLNPSYPTYTGNANYFVPYLENGTMAVVDILSQKELFTFKVIGAQSPEAIVTPNGDVLVNGGESWLAFNAQGQFLYEDNNLYLPTDASHFVEGNSLYYAGEEACVRRFDVTTGQKTTVVPMPTSSMPLTCGFIDAKTVLYSHARINYNNGDYSDKWLARVEIATNKTIWNISDVAGTYRGEDNDYFYVAAYGDSSYGDSVFTVINKTDVTMRKSFPGFIGVGQNLGLPFPGLTPRPAANNANLLSLTSGSEVQRLNRINMANGVIEKQIYLGEDDSTVTVTSGQLLNFKTYEQTFVSYSYPGADTLCSGSFGNNGGSNSDFSNSEDYDGRTYHYQNLPGTDLLVVDGLFEIHILDGSNCQRVMSLSRPLNTETYNVPKTVVDGANRRFTFQVGDTVEIYGY